MCLNCEERSTVTDCAYDENERHPDDWTGVKSDYPSELPAPFDWSDEKGKPLDSNERPYNPFQGSVTPTDGRCNATLTNTMERYGEHRYCMRLPESTFVDDEDASEYCQTHRKYELNDAFMKRARDAFKHGIFSKSIRHVYTKLEAWQQLTVLAWYDAYMQESRYDFSSEVEPHVIDFTNYVTDDDRELPLEIKAELDDENKLQIGVPTPTQHANRAFALYRAAVMDVKSGLAERVILETSDDGVMRRERTVGFDDSGREYTEYDEHELNLPLSRLDGDRNDLLSFGGVHVDGTDDAAVNVNVDEDSELVLDLDEDSEPKDAADASLNPVENAMMSNDTSTRLNDTDSTSNSDSDGSNDGRDVDGDDV